jgi:hypothetical protein
MFNDILTSNEKDDITWNKQCTNCAHASHILSNYPEKIFCQEKERHMEKAFYCRGWIERLIDV